MVNDKFIKDNESLIKRILRKYPFIIDYEDVLQEARIWLIQAEKKWNPKKASWETYLTNFIRYKYIDYLKYKNKRCRSAETNGYHNISLEELGEESIFCFDEKTDMKLLYDSALKHIRDGRNKEIVELRLQGYTLREIAKKYSLTHQSIALIFNNEITKLKIALIKKR